MLDIKLVREDPELIRRDLQKRDMPGMLNILDELIELDVRWRETKQKEEELRHIRNVLSKEIAVLKQQGKDAKDKLLQVKKIPEKIENIQKRREKLREKIDHILLILPNILHSSVPVGADDTQNKIVRVWGKKIKKQKSHVDILLEKDLAEIERAAKIAGSRFYYLKNELVLMDYALMQLSMDFLVKKNFLLIEPPFMMKKKPYEGVTSLGDFEEVMYKIEGEDLYLIATSEHPIAAMYMDEVIEANKLPLKFAGISPCFRKEAGSHGKDTKGIFRVHHFNKVEQFVFCRPDESWKLFEKLIKNAEELIRLLRIPYRVVNVCTGDIGLLAAKKYDLEVWMPAQQKYREVISCSNCTDYQARRLNIKYTDGKIRDYVHTINSTALATGRIIVAILENFQNKDGSISIPKALRKYMGKEKI
ncbi:serine--tRNA ligase [Candidatus Woesearchaeota archaeon]|nr:serine--tRNA ligase [Candidatus Woesearchaeota archaeon]